MESSLDIHISQSGKLQTKIHLISKKVTFSKSLHFLLEPRISFFKISSAAPRILKRKIKSCKHCGFYPTLLWFFSNDQIWNFNLLTPRDFFMCVLICEAYPQTKWLMKNRISLISVGPIPPSNRESQFCLGISECPQVAFKFMQCSSHSYDHWFLLKST